MTITDLKDITSFKWATVANLTPLAIKLDGDSAPLALVPESIIDPLTLLVGDRVRVELSLRKVVIHGRANGAGLLTRINALEASAARVGLKKIKPTSVTGLTSGTASVDANGKITFSNVVNGLVLNGLFPAGRGRYRVRIVLTGTTVNDYVYLRGAKAGVTSTVAAFYYQSLYVQSGTVGSFDNIAASQFMRVGYCSTNGGNMYTIDLEGWNDGLAGPIVRYDTQYGATSPTEVKGAGAWNGSGTWDGFWFYMGSGNFSGEMQVYEYA